MKKSFKSTLKLILLPIFGAAVLIFVYFGIIQRSDNNKLTVGNGSYDSMKSSDGRTMTISDGDLILQVGQSRQCRVIFDNGSPAEGAFWSSNNEKTAVVSSDGKVTAVAPGETELLAVIGRDKMARIKVTVFQDLTKAAADAVAALAANGSDEAMKLVDSMADNLLHAVDKKFADLGSVMSAVSAFQQAGAKGDDSAPLLWEELIKAVKASETDLDTRTLRQAALAAYSQGEKSSSDLTISFTGDCTLGYYNEVDTTARFPYIYEHSGSETYPFDLTRQVFGADDITMINFEGTLTESTIHRKKQFYFRGKPSYVKILTGSSIEAVTVENNHSFDYFETGYNDTLDCLRSAGVAYTSLSSPAVLDVKGVRVVMLSLCLVNTSFTDEMREQTVSRIRQYKQNGALIVMNIHWGVEGNKTCNRSQIKVAHFLIDAGVDLVIGHHPHVPQGIERYNGHYIIYSLGNFSFGGNAKANKPETFILRAMFGKDNTGNLVLNRISVVPCLTTSTGSKINNYRPTPLYGRRGKFVVDELLWLSSHIQGGVDSLTWSMIP